MSYAHFTCEFKFQAHHSIYQRRLHKELIQSRYVMWKYPIASALYLLAFLDVLV